MHVQYSTAWFINLRFTKMGVGGGGGEVGGGGGGGEGRCLD